ncbi:PAS domain-containing sensor histidine kinase, partial [bacterium]|nr:PAS domain-containing sensor histidine kinase [bacterium]
VTSVRRAEQFRSDLVANVSHELRTPLTAIKGFAETLQEDLKLGAVDTAQDHVAIISRNADRLMSLIDDLLVLSRLESGKDELQIQALDTQSITSQAIDGLTELQRRMGHQVKVECSASTVFGDPLRVEQVLTNLIGNALRYAPATSGPVVVVWRETAKDVVLEVSDSGPGIPSELHDRIFERFFRIDFGRSRDSGGTGLGLAIVKHILQRHGGRIELESAPGQGTRFLCFFPKR